MQDQLEKIARLDPRSVLQEYNTLFYLNGSDKKYSLEKNVDESKIVKWPKTNMEKYSPFVEFSQEALSQGKLFLM